MAMEMYNYCVLCNPEKNWLEVEFRSENDEPIKNLKVTITNPSTLQTHQMIAHQGHCIFGDIAAGEWVVSVETENLLSTVEQYASRKKEESSPVKSRAKSELGAAHKNPTKYYNVSVGDLWVTPPEDMFLIDNHGALMSNVRPELNGFRAYHNATFVLEIKALRSYMPMIVDTDEFSLVNSYNFALLAQQAYASNEFGIPRDKKLPDGGHKNVLQALKARQQPQYTADKPETWLVEDIPYSQALSGEYFHDDNIGAEGYIFSNDEIAIIGVRGTETHFSNEELFKTSETHLAEQADAGSPYPVMEVLQVADGVIAAFNSPGYQDVVSDINASQIAPPEFGGSYIHQGFYRYAMALWKPIKDAITKKHSQKYFFVCGHSLGGAGALLLSALIQNTYQPATLRLFTYGMPRTGTYSFVSRYKQIVHHRHVNNHDLVPQVPMRWMNTNPDDKYASHPWWAFINPILDLVVDNDSDNYQHHGNLTQLLTYSENKHHPEPVEQVLLTPRQTHINSLTLLSNKIDDSYRLADSLSQDYIDINGYIGTVVDSGMDHKMSEYIPNIKAQLRFLLNDNLDKSYQAAARVVENTTRLLVKSYKELKIGQTDAFGMQYVYRKDPAAQAQDEYKRTQALFKIKLELEANEKLALNNQRIMKELQTLAKDASLLPMDNLLFGDRVSDKSSIKEQLQ
ncbi:lipase family protein [Vibrio sp.]|uniref:lipase family protein n=1 Tax=Vibrio sp. TaxID=678 RepID=UPI003AA88934